VDALMLDIGGDVGALVLHAPAELVDQEVEVSLIDQAGIRTHTVVHQMRLADGEVFAGVMPSLQAGVYTVWGLDDQPVGEVRITGGSVTEFTWPAISS
jgi:hypothetical protein